MKGTRLQAGWPVQRQHSNPGKQGGEVVPTNEEAMGLEEVAGFGGQWIRERKGTKS